MIITAFRTSAILSFNPKWSEGRIALVFFCLLLSVSSVYGKNKEWNYLKNGVSFSLPGDWKTISDEALPAKGYYFSAERTGRNATGLFTLVSINDEENPVKSLLGAAEKHERGGYLQGFRHRVYRN